VATLSEPAAVTVAVVSWNTRELLLRCLGSMRGDVEAGRAQVVVVDNGSGDGSAAAVRDQAPWAELIELPRNIGFGRAVNLVAGRTQSQWLAAANADVALRPGALRTLVEAGSRVDIGAVAPRLLLADGATQHSAHSLPTVGLALVHAAGLYQCSPRLADALCLEGHWDADRDRDVPWAIAAFLLLRRRAFDAVGGFDDRQWMYAEDLDLGWRLRDAGWATRYAPAACVEHASGAATAALFGDGRRRRFMRASYLVIARRRGPASARTTAAINAAGALARVGWMAPAALVDSRWRAPAKDAMAWVAPHLDGLRSPAALARLDREPGWARGRHG
jgi:GT2 family glycosyltransferase